MITIDELRVGSYVLKENPNNGNKKEICKISIKSDDSRVSLIRMCTFEDFSLVPKLNDEARYVWPSNPVDIHLINPCPLSTKALEEFGFKPENLNEDTTKYVKYPLEIIYNITNGFKYNIDGRFKEVASLHTLQNLYYELTDSVLVLKEIEERLENVNKIFKID